jgi:hypothetical protein
MKNVCSITRGQAHEIVTQIENVIKNYGGNPEKVAKIMLDQGYLKKVTEQRMEALGCKPKILEATGWAATSTSSGNEYVIGRDLRKILRYDFFPQGEHEEISKIFADTEFADTETISGKLVKVIREKVSGEDVIEEAKKLGIYKEYEIGPALIMADELVKMGVMGSTKIVYIYLSYWKNPSPKLQAWVKKPLLPIQAALVLERRGDKIELYLDDAPTNLVSLWHVNKGYAYLFD